MKRGLRAAELVPVVEEVGPGQADRVGLRPVVLIGSLRPPARAAGYPAPTAGGPASVREVRTRLVEVAAQGGDDLLGVARPEGGEDREDGGRRSSARRRPAPRA